MELFATLGHLYVHYFNSFNCYTKNMDNALHFIISTIPMYHCNKLKGLTITVSNLMYVGKTVPLIASSL
jgi:hypothetical protein